MKENNGEKEQPQDLIIVALLTRTGRSQRSLTSRGLVSLRKVFRSPPAISSSRMNLGMACRLTPTQRTMFWWLNLLEGTRGGRL